MATEGNGKYEVLPARKEDIPQGVTVYVGQSVREAFGGWVILEQDASDRELVEGEESATTAPQKVISIPVRLEISKSHRDGDNSSVRVSMHLRTLTGIKSSIRNNGKTVERADCSITESPAQIIVTNDGRQPRRGVVRRFILGIQKLARRLDHFVEVKVWRPLFRAPQFSMRVTPSHPGEDQHDIVRMHPSCFSDLGITPGSHVVLTWMGAETVATALEDPFPHGSQDSSAEHMKRFQAVTTSSGDIPDGVPANLVIRASQQLRQQLGVVDFPMDDIVVIVGVRRRIGTVLRSHINRLAAPALVLVLAAAAIPELRGTPVILGGLGVLLIVVLSFWPLKMPKAPSGRWP